jgi:hypothetical protein
MRTFLEWHAERENRLGEIGLLLTKAPASHARDQLVMR